MDELEIAPKTHSLVTVDYELQANEIPPRVVYMRQTVLLLRRIVPGSVVDLNITEVRAILPKGTD
tara:strand:+ start:301 stop:495 length:195 start_codon:yes stop_codon:yes gene_type:complete